MATGGAEARIIGRHSVRKFIFGKTGRVLRLSIPHPAQARGAIHGVRCLDLPGLNGLKHSGVHSAHRAAMMEPLSMAVTSDTLPTATRVSDPGIRALYRLENRWQAWLDVEAALARAQAELGIIPPDAAEAIAKAAHYELMDRARLDEGFARTGHTIVPLVWELSRVVGDKHGGWVHWGATTQNITQTGDLLVLRQAHRVILGLIGEALAALADLAERAAEM